MQDEVYRFLEHGDAQMHRFFVNEDARLGAFLDCVTEHIDPLGLENEEIEAFLMQRQAHVLDRADRPWHR